jgi:hypothetical protein
MDSISAFQSLTQSSQCNSLREGSHYGEDNGEEEELAFINQLSPTNSSLHRQGSKKKDEIPVLF